jgi:hypothetical protein
LTAPGIAELDRIHEDLAHLVRPHRLVSASEARRMAARVRRCGNVSLLARSLRDAGVRAGLR